MAQEPAVHDAAFVCRENRQTGLNTFEEGPADPLPECGSNCDVYSQLMRGAITKGFNIGLSFPQSKPLNVETYNQGCADPWGCVDNLGFSCKGAVSHFGPSMDAQFKRLNAAYEPSGLEYHPPAYAMGIKNGTVNSVTGWSRGAGGRPAWESHATTRLPCLQR